MKTSRTTWLLFACLATPAVYATTPQLGGNANNIGLIDGPEFSTTTRLNGEVLFRTRDLLGENDIGEAALFGNSRRLRLSFDSSFTGDDVLADQAAPPQLVRVFGGAGNNENVQEGIYNSESSMFYFLGGDIGASLQNGPLDVFVGGGGTVTYYDEDLVWRQDDENWVPDIYGSIGARYAISDSVRAKLFARGYYGGHASVGREFVKDGVTSDNYFFWDLDLGVDARVDGAALGQKGLEFSINFGWGGFEDEGDGPSSTQLDNYDVNFRGEARYNLDEETTVFGTASYGHREFGDFRIASMYDIDSHNYRFGGGARAQWGDNFSWSGEAGVEIRDYDDLPATGEDEQTEFYINGNVNWTPCAHFILGAYADYGIQNFNINEGPAEAFIDPLGVRSGIRARYLWNETTTLTAQGNVTHVDGSDVVNSMYGGDEFFRWACGLSLTHMFNDRLELFAAGEIVQLDNDRDDDTFFNGGVGARFGF